MPKRMGKNVLPTYTETIVEDHGGPSATGESPWGILFWSKRQTVLRRVHSLSHVTLPTDHFSHPPQSTVTFSDERVPNQWLLFVRWFFSPFSLKLKIFFKRATLILKVSYKLHKVFHEGTKNVHLPNTNLIPHNSCCFVPGSCKQRLPSCRG